MQIVGHFINGKVTKEAPETDAKADVFNPATGQVIKSVSLASQQTVQEAINAAAMAFPQWRDTPPVKRARIMFKFKMLLEQHADEIASLISAEHGKILHDALGEFGRGVENVEYACGVPELLKGEHSKNAGSGIDSWSEFQPLGVVAGISPFNFPVMVPMWMFPLAIVCGNTFVLKPSEKAPSAPLRIAELLHEAGLPQGVFNVVNGDKEAVDTIIDSQRVQAISFVGSTPVAKSIYERGTANHKRVQALGGAKNHAVVMPDADIDNAVSAIMGAAYGSCGERCMAISVVVAVGDDVGNTLVEVLKQKIFTLKVGQGDDNNNDMGPLISKLHLEKVISYIETGVKEGATLVADGRNFSVKNHEKGFFLHASLFDHVEPTMKIYQDEIFGPVLCVLRVNNLEQAMTLINKHEFGNGTCVFTQDGGVARFFTDHIKVGMVGVNVPLPVPIASQSFGGWKSSLFGDLYAYGPDGVRFYTRRKTITQRWSSSGIEERVSFSFPN